MDGYAIGLIEVVGKIAAIEAADAGLKAANVGLIGVENATGALLTVKFCGDVGAVKAALEAAKAKARQLGAVVVASLFLPRPASGITPMLISTEKGNESRLAADKEQVEEIAVAAKTAVESLAEESTEDRETIDESDTAVMLLSKATCNICSDPKCPRQKGQSSKYCIHAARK